MDVWQSKVADAEGESTALRQELGRLARLRKKALDQLMKEVITDEDFKSIDRGVAADSSAVRERLAFVQGGKLDLDTAKEYLEYLLWNTSAVWQSCELQGKKQIQHRIFPNGLPRSKNGFGTPITSSFYSMLGDEIREDSALVAPQGFIISENKRDKATAN